MSDPDADAKLEPGSTPVPPTIVGRDLAPVPTYVEPPHAGSPPPILPSPAPDPAAPPPPPAWPPWRRVLFRFFALYLGLYTLPFPLGTIPGTVGVAAQYEQSLGAVAGWFGKNVLRFAEAPRVFPTGSGDTPIEYCKVALFAVVALLGATLWTLLARRATAHSRLHALLRIQIRYVLATAMLGYGFAKVFKTQFQSPDGEALFTALGDKTPMGLLWSFMGFSTVYTIFVGAAEALGGTLLLWRRTTTLGALVCAAVMLNVTLLNFCYDVPVKLYASHLLAMAVFLALPDVPRLCSALVLNRTTPPAVLRPFALIGRRTVTVPATALKLLFAGFLFVTSAHGGYRVWREFGETANLPPLHGIYDVVAFERAGDVIPAGSDDPRLWKRFTVGRYELVAIATETGGVGYYSFKNDTDKRQLVLTAPRPFRPAAPATTASPPPPAREDVLTYETPAPGELVLEGTFDGAPLRVTLKKRPRESFPLYGRGFRWMQDYPVNG